ncbi:MAG: cysteine--tRNA ligase [Pseudomonadales bacterium]|jgi:cysteinyl-tRNA synthetase|nr:cysteine--tRNA ligase [Pseudomonadales bacterium]MDP6470501.1 cysteine--tRNA ligase [Pseudomonadales bacterium]MDP6827803.1 cysteine--tRNA ligase [Pseudomonadales bacterium]MDP6972975.1 cysteine--tRNA ligase [Pseudomonadales bacterium]
MELKLYNTLSGRKQPFAPVDPDRVTIYVCGPTVYNYVHIGNGRPAVVFDVLVRLLGKLYPQVAYARNITDIDDKINAAALENGEPIAELAERFTNAYNDDIRALGVKQAAVEPRATHHIDVIIDMIQRLVDKGHAYEGDGHVLFNVPSDPAYGSLSRRSLEDMLDGARVEIAPYKKDAKDFVLWKPSSAELPGWDSPWGRGRPGWHIECSAMIHKHLGTTIDIHGGGSDLTFPHHENELAQSTCANDAEFVRFWLHNGMLTMGQEKMSKSLGNIVTIRELRQRYPGEALRYALLSGQYRSPLAWSADLIDQAQASLDTLYQALRDAGLGNDTALDHADLGINDYPKEIVQPLLDDLNTPQALAGMHQLAGDLNKAVKEERKRHIRAQLLSGGWLLGILESDVIEWFQGSGTADGVDANAIQALIDARNEARAARDFQRADEIRDELTVLGVELEDTRDGTRWKTS